MRVHDWTFHDGVFLVAPVRRRVRLEVVAAAAPLAVLSVGATIMSPYALPFALAVALPFVLLTYVASKHRRCRLTIRDEQLKFESATWKQAGQWVPRGECPTSDVCGVAYYQSGRTSRIALRFHDRPPVVIVDVELSPQQTESLAAAISERLGVPAQEWTWTELAFAPR